MSRNMVLCGSYGTGFYVKCDYDITMVRADLVHLPQAAIIAFFMKLGMYGLKTLTITR